MSKTPFWQPGDRWQPPIVRIKGVDEKSPAGQQLMRAYEGTIKQFYLGAARAHALGIIDNSRSRKQFPDAQMTYTNMMGQEIVEVELRPEVVESGGGRISGRSPPDWLLVEFVIEDGSRINSDFAAFARTPDWHKLDAAVGGHIIGTSLGNGHWGGLGAVLIMQDGRLTSGISPISGAVPTIRVIDRGAPHRNTFVVDLRRLRNWPVLAFDFYGWVTSVEYSPELVTYNRGSPTTGVVADYGGYMIYEFGGGVGPVTETNLIGVSVGMSHGVADFKYVEALNALHTNSVPSDIPATKDTPDTVETWILTGNGNGGTVTDLGGGLFRKDNSNFWTQQFWPYIPEYIVAATAREVTLDVRHNIFTGGNLEWYLVRWQHLLDGPFPLPEVPDTSLYPYEQDFRTWEHPNFAETSLPTTHVAFSDVQSFTPSDAPAKIQDSLQHYGYPYFGTYTLVQDEWSGSWGAPGSGT